MAPFKCSHCDIQLSDDILVPDVRDSLIIYRCPSCKEFIKERKNLIFIHVPRGPPGSLTGSPRFKSHSLHSIDQVARSYRYNKALHLMLTLR
jgi:uncharacterized C2H2 Zn-finger protein